MQKLLMYPQKMNLKYYQLVNLSVFAKTFPDLQYFSEKICLWKAFLNAILNLQLTKKQRSEQW